MARHGAFHWFGAVAAVLITVAATAPAAAAGEHAQQLVVLGGSFSVDIAPQGGIQSVVFADGQSWQLGGRSLLTEDPTLGSADQCSSAGGAQDLAGGAVSWTTSCAGPAGMVTDVTDELKPSAHGSISWTTQVSSTGGTYAKGIWTQLSGTPSDTEFWTTWGQSPKPPVGQNPTWTDPLSPAPFTNLALPYGGHATSGQNGFSVPIFTILQQSTNHALSLIQSPGDTLLDAQLVTDTAGDVSFGRFNNRISPSHPVTFHMNLVASAASVRPGLGWMVNRYPRYFDSTTSASSQLDGLSSYSYFTGPFTSSQQAEFGAMDYSTNWDASFAWPYMGEFLPPVTSPEQTWMPFGQYVHSGAPTTMSVSSLDQTVQNWSNAGFHELAYFDTTEYGTTAGVYGAAPAQACTSPDLWTNPASYLSCDFPDAELKMADGSPIQSWEGDVLVDPGDPAYQQHLLSQARALLTEVPGYSGIDIDRTDELERYNTHVDDGVTWYNGGPARSLVTSWKQLMPKLEAEVHALGKQVWVSPTDAKRIDEMAGVDGILSEYDNGDLAMNLDAFLGLDRPVLGWNYNLGSDPDEFLQRWLYMGVNPMAPLPDNDHGIQDQSSSTTASYEKYGAMFKALQGRRWDLEPNPVTVSTGTALANVFIVPGGVVVPVVEGGTAASIGVSLHALQRAVPGIDLTHAQYLTPETSAWRNLPVAEGVDGTVTMNVPLTDGAAEIRLVTHQAESTLAPQVLISTSKQFASLDAPATVTATVWNDSTTPVNDLAATLQAPADWSAVPAGPQPTTLQPTQTAAFSWTVAPLATGASSLQTFTSTVTYQQGGNPGQQVADVQLAAGSAPTVTDEKLDTTTQGNWQGTYGSQGYVIPRVGQSLPADVSVDVSPGDTPYVWNANTADTRALQLPSGSGRIAATWFNSASLSFQVSATDAHRISLYLLDWDEPTNGVPRNEEITVTDVFGNVLDQLNPGNFSAGQYVSWNFTGTIIVNATYISGPPGGNAVVSAIFLDPAT